MSEISEYNPFALSNMPGPCDVARRIQQRQAWAFEALCDIRQPNYASQDEFELARQAAKAAYEATVAELDALLGPDAYVGHVDMELHGCFSDCFKSDAGFRPRFHMSRRDVLAWFERQRAANAPEPKVPVKEAARPERRNEPVRNTALADKLRAALKR